MVASSIVAAPGTAGASCGAGDDKSGGGSAGRGNRMARGAQGAGRGETDCAGRTRRAAQRGHRDCTGGKIRGGASRGPAWCWIRG